MHFLCGALDESQPEAAPAFIHFFFFFVFGETDGGSKLACVFETARKKPAR